MITAEGVVRITGRLDGGNAVDLREWFVREFERCGPRMNLIAYGVLRDGHRARDAVQEAALRVYQKLDTVRDDRSLSGYLFVTTRNVALDMLKKTNRSQPTEKLEPKSPTDSWRPNADELALLRHPVLFDVDSDAWSIRRFQLHISIGQAF